LFEDPEGVDPEPVEVDEELEPAAGAALGAAGVAAGAAAAGAGAASEFGLSEPLFEPALLDLPS
jgi:hypothetical protein